MQHAFQIVSRAPAPAGLSRHDFLESLLAVLIPFAYVVWKHSHPPMTGVLAALGCGAVFILGKFLFRHYAGRFHRQPPATLTLVDDHLVYMEGGEKRWSVMVKDIVGHDRVAPLLVHLRTQTDHFVVPAQRFHASDLAALFDTIGLPSAQRPDDSADHPY